MPFPVSPLGFMGSGFTEIAWTISPNTTDYDEAAWRADAVAAGWNELSPAALVATLETGSVMGATSTANAAFDTGTTPLPPGATLTFVNRGSVLGRGGNGGAGGSAQNAVIGSDNPGSPGENGGTAIRAQIPITINNASGTIGGGGGGGGGGGASREPPDTADPAAVETGGGGGGGGGQGFVNSAGGSGGSAENVGSRGGNGSANSRGGGGGGGAPPGPPANGGNGGTLGNSGGNGQTSVSGRSGGAGGAPGAAVIGIENVTFAARGDVRGESLPL